MGMQDGTMEAGVQHAGKVGAYHLHSKAFTDASRRTDFPPRRGTVPVPGARISIGAPDAEWYAICRLHLARRSTPNSPMRTLVLLAFLLLAATGGATAARAADPAGLDARLARLTPLQQDEVVWLARCIYSESDRADEQRLVAWVVRNRVETRYRGYTYREVILEAQQFSAFNTPTPRRERILDLDADSPAAPWRQALGIALDVYEADASKRPFAVTTRHFYSPVSMTGRDRPLWAEGRTPLSSERLGVDPDRFLFFDGIDEQLANTPATALSAPTPSPRTTGGSLRPLPRLQTRATVRRPARPVVPGVR